MKNVIAAASAVALATFAIQMSAATTARADANAAFCLEVTGQDRVCDYKTIEQCQEAARGRAGTCVPNPR